MTLISILIALALEQLRPLGSRNRLLLHFTRYANRLERNLNAGESRHGLLAWLLAVVPFVALAYGIYAALYQVTPVLALLWNVAVLYLTMGFRHFSGAITDISKALADGRVGFAALDVFAVEPLPADSPLWDDPRVLVSPHTAALNSAEDRLIARLFARNATRFLDGRDLINRVDTVEFY